MYKLISVKNCIFLLLVFTHFSKAQSQINWEKVNGPNEGVTALAVASNNEIYLGTTNFGVFRSSDEGSTWVNFSQGLGDSLIRGIAVSSEDEIFAGTGAHGIYRYSQGSWTPANDGLPGNSSLVWAFASGLAGDMYMISVADDIYKWDGNSWISIKFNLPALARALAVGSSGILYTGCFNSGIYEFNGTNSWSLVGEIPNPYITKLAISSTDTLYAVCNSNNVFRIPASGGIWTPINTGLPSLNATMFGIDNQDNLFFAVTNNGYGNIYRSANKGDTWSMVSGSLSTSSFYSFCFSPSGRIYAGASGIYKSPDHGNSWEDMNPGLDARKAIVSFTGSADGTLFVGTQYAGIWRSDDNGATWEQKTSGLTTNYSFQITGNAAGDLLYAAFIPGTPSKGVIFRSVDKGDAWTQVAKNGTDLYTKIKQHNSDTLWATGRFGGAVLSYSIDDGETWTDSPIPSFSAIWDIELTSGSTIYLGSESEGVSRSSDGGKSWIEGVGNSIPWYGNVIEVETDTGGYLFAATDWWANMLWYSLPGSNGDQWTKFLDTDLNGLSDINDLVFDNSNNAYIATNNGSYTDPVYMAANSTWNENTDWVSASNGLPPNAKAAQLGFDASGYMYSVFYFLGSEGGLYRSTQPVNIVEPTNTESFETSTTLNIFPNPSSGNFEVVLYNTHPVLTTIEIFNVSGQQVYKSEVDSVKISLSLDIPPGIYFIRSLSRNQNPLTYKLIIR